MSAQLYINGIAADMPVGSQIPLTRQVNDIAELKDRQADYSNQFNLPRTPLNEYLLQNAKVRNSASLEQYGVTIKGYVSVRTKGSTIACEFYSGAANFFEEIGDDKLTSLDISELEHQFNNINILNARLHDWEQGYIYPFIDTARDTSVVDPTLRNINSGGMIPAVYAKYLLNKIGDKYGWKIAGAPINDGKFLKTALPLCKNNASGNYLNTSINNAPLLVGWHLFGSGAKRERIIPFQTIVADPTTQVVTLTYPTYLSGYLSFPASPTFRSPKMVTDVVTDVLIRFSTQQASSIGYLYFTAPVKFPIECMASVKLVAYTEDTITPDVTEYRVIKEWIYGVDYTAHGAHAFLAEQVKAFEGERLCVIVNIDTDNVLGYSTNQTTPVHGHEILAGASMVMSNVKQVGNGFPATLGRYWDMSGNLPDMSIKDFLKNIAQRYCCHFDTDASTRTIEFVPFQEIIDNIPRAYDWSDKVEELQSTHNFHSNYAQLNWMKYSDTEDEPDGYADASFTIADEILSAEKTSFTLQFAGCYHKPAWTNKRFPLVPVFGDTWEDGATFSGAKPRWVLINRVATDDIATLVTTSGNNNIFTDFPYCYFEDLTDSRADDLTMEASLTREYRGIIRCLQNYEMIDERVHLTPAEFHSFNHRIPVYIAKHQAYFYVNKIESFVEGRMTKVQLFKLS